MKRRSIVRLSTEYLHKALYLREDIEIIDVEFNAESGQVAVILTGEGAEVVGRAQFASTVSMREVTDRLIAEA